MATLLAATPDRNTGMSVTRLGKTTNTSLHDTSGGWLLQVEVNTDMKHSTWAYTHGHGSVMFI